MFRYRVVLLAILGASASGAGGAGAQTRLSTALNATIPALTALSQLPGEDVQVSHGPVTQHDGVLLLRVSANAGWRLVAASVNDPSGTASVRVQAGGADGHLVRLLPGATLATGARGAGIELRVDYVVPVGSAVPQVEFRAEPEEATR